MNNRGMKSLIFIIANVILIRHTHGFDSIHSNSFNFLDENANPSEIYAASKIEWNRYPVEENTRTSQKDRCSNSYRRNINRGVSEECSEYLLKDEKITEAGANVLILHPIYAGSHEVVMRSIGSKLVRRGHKVSQLRFKTVNQAIDFKQKKSKHEHNDGIMANETHYQHRNGCGNETNGCSENFGKYLNVITVSVNNTGKKFPYITEEGALEPPAKLLWDTHRVITNIPTDVFGVVHAHCSTLLGDHRLLEALRAENFTVALVDIISNECSLAMAHLLGLPVLGYWGFPIHGPEARRMGMLHSPSFVPAMMTEHSSQMTFLERVKNVVVAVLEEALITYHFHVIDGWIRLLQPSVPNAARLLSSVDALLVGVSWHLDYAKPLPPHFRYVGCLTCGPPMPLDPQMLQWMKGSSAGVIVFSFGLTGFDSAVVPDQFRTSVLNAMASLDRHRFVLHFDPQKLPYLPDNVLARVKIPQQDLLGHPSTVLFVSHCGMNSVNEGAYHGVPLLCVPNFADQGDISRRVVDAGIGQRLDKHNINKKMLMTAMQEVIRGPSYRARVQHMSRMLQQATPGADHVMHWVEKLHRFGPQRHTRPAALHLSFLQYYCLDVAAFLLVLLALLGLFCVLVFNFVFSRLKNIFLGGKLNKEKSC